MYPYVTVIMPIHNEEMFIHHSLGAVLEQDYPSDRIEVLVVDGMSTDQTPKIIQQFIIESGRKTVRLLKNNGRIVPAGLNLAIRQARGDIIVRVDGHTVIAPDYVRKCVETLQRTHADNVGGRMNAVGVGTFGKTVALATSTSFGIGNGHFHYSEKEEWVDTVYMGAWPRQVFERLGQFDEELVRDQDDEFNYRLRAAGGRILLDPQIKSEYTVRSSRSKLWQQYYQYGLWKVRVLQKHPRQMSLRQFIPPVFVLGLLGSILLASSSSFRPLALILPVLYAVANLTASAITSAKKGWNYMLLLPVVFSVLHISYGLGFLTGLIRFANRWGDRHGKVSYWQPRKIST